MIKQIQQVHLSILRQPNAVNYNNMSDGGVQQQ